MTCGDWRIVSPAAFSWICKLSGTCNHPKNQQISGQKLRISELVLRTYISGENLSDFRAMGESL